MAAAATELGTSIDVVALASGEVNVPERSRGAGGRHRVSSREGTGRTGADDVAARI